MRMMIRRTRGVLLALMAIWACDNSNDMGATVEPGDLVVSVASPYADDGAMVISIRGAPIQEPATVDPSNHVFVLPEEGEVDAMHVAVIGERLVGDLLVFGVVDLQSAAALDVRILQAADMDNELRDDLSGYRLFVTPASGS